MFARPASVTSNRLFEDAADMCLEQYVFLYYQRWTAFENAPTTGLRKDDTAFVGRGAQDYE